VCLAILASQAQQTDVPLKHQVAVRA
jgi:hypothetical protein